MGMDYSCLYGAYTCACPSRTGFECDFLDAWVNYSDVQLNFPPWDDAILFAGEYFLEECELAGFWIAKNQ